MWVFMSPTGYGLANPQMVYMADSVSVPYEKSDLTECILHELDGKGDCGFGRQDITVTRVGRVVSTKIR